MFVTVHSLFLLISSSSQVVHESGVSLLALRAAAQQPFDSLVTSLMPDQMGPVGSLLSALWSLEYLLKSLNHIVICEHQHMIMIKEHTSIIQVIKGKQWLCDMTTPCNIAFSSFYPKFISFTMLPN